MHASMWRGGAAGRTGLPTVFGRRLSAAAFADYDGRNFAGFTVQMGARLNGSSVVQIGIIAVILRR